MKEPTPVTIHDPQTLATYLDRIRGDYPYGIATSLIASPAPVSHSAMLIVVSPDGQQLEGPHAELLEGVITKGLKLTPERCPVSVVRADDPLQVCVARTLESSHAPVCVVLGGEKAPGSVEEISGVRVLYSYAVERIVHESAVKRELWRHLQEHVLPLVRGE